MAKKRLRKSPKELAYEIQKILSLERRQAGLTELHQLVSSRVGKPPSFTTLYKSLRLVPHLRMKLVPSGGRPRSSYYLDTMQVINDRIRELEALLRTCRTELSTSQLKDIRNKLQRLKIFIPE